VAGNAESTAVKQPQEKFPHLESSASATESAGAASKLSIEGNSSSRPPQHLDHAQNGDSHAGGGSPYGTLEGTFDRNGKSALGGAENVNRQGADATGRPNTAEPFLPPIALDAQNISVAPKLKKPDLTIPKDAQDRAHYDLPDGTYDAYKDKSGNEVEVFNDVKNPKDSFRRETTPDASSTTQTNADGTTESTDGKFTTVKDKNHTTVTDKDGNSRTEFANGTSSEHRVTPDGYVNTNKGPKPADNFTVSQHGDINKTSRIHPKTGDTQEKVINLKDATQNYTQVTHQDGTYDKTLANGLTVHKDLSGNITTANGRGDKTIEYPNHDYDQISANGRKIETRFDADGTEKQNGTGPHRGDNFTSVVYPNGDTSKTVNFGNGHTVEVDRSKDDRKNVITEKWEDGSQSVTDRDGTTFTDKKGVQSYTTTDGKELKANEVDAYKKGERAELNNIHNDGGADATYAAKIKQAVDGLPKDVQQFLAKHNVQIKESDNMGKIWPETKDQQLRNYPPGETEATEGTGAYNQQKHEIAMAERKTSSDPAGTVRHEVGHAVDDDASGDGTEISNSAQFKAAYEKDVANLTPEQKKALSYYLEKDGGREETFAELSADKFGGRADQDTFSNPVGLDKYMPNTADLVNRFYDNDLHLDPEPPSSDYVTPK
jgi:hypothetical protein